MRRSPLAAVGRIWIIWASYYSCATSKLGAELLFEVISVAYERQSVMITTNLPFERWVEVLGSERLTGAVLDRLTHRCHIIECNGESYRLKDAKRRQGKRKRGK